MATLNELGRNSASITYGPSSTGAEMWPTLQLFDTWVKNDTMQGYATATGTNVTGVGSIYTTQLRSGDVVMLAGQMRTVSTVTSDTLFSVTAGFAQGVTSPSALKQINTTLTGASTATIRGTTTGTISVTNGSNVVTGVGTYFLSELTNSVTTATVAGTVSLDINGNINGSGTSFATGADGGANRLQPGDSVWMGGFYYTIAGVTSDTSATIVNNLIFGSTTATVLSNVIIAKAVNSVIGRTININGRVRQIAGFSSNLSMTLNAVMDFTDSNLRVKNFPRGTISVSSGASAVTSSGANFLWDLVSGDQVWVGNELRTFSFGSQAPATATLSDFVGYSGTATTVLKQAVSSIAFKRDDTYINATSGQFLTELRVGDDLIIDGTEVTVASIISNTQFRCTLEFTHTITAGSTIYKKKKVHGFTLEGTREGVGTGNKFSTVTIPSGVTAPGSLTLVVGSATGMTQYGLLKIQAAGGPPVVLTGLVALTSASSTVTGSNTQFTTQLHVGAEIVIAGQYFTVSAIASDVSLTTTIAASATVIWTPIYRTVPLYTYIASIASTTITLGHNLKNGLDIGGATTSPQVFTPSAATDFIEYVYSAPNKSAEASTTLFNTSLDRKYVAFRMYPLTQGGGSGNTLATAGSTYSLPVYERWVASYGQAGGVGINVADASTATSGLSNVFDQTNMTQTTGGFLYLFGKPRYLIVQGKTFSNIQQQWLACIEFERAQPEDVGTGLGVSTGVSIFTGAPVSGTPGVAPWPCYAYFNGNRFPVGSQQTPTLPVAQTGAVHGGIFSVPRVRCSTGDLTGLNAHIYSACTITTGRWGHLYELAAIGAYNPVPAPSGGFMIATNTANAVPQPHMGQLVPVYTNVYNSKRFMFSPVVILGPSYDPDIRGRIFGLKVIPSALGTLMDTVSVTVDSNDFYDSTASAADHWVITASTSTVNFTLQNSGSSVSQSWRSLEFATQPTANTTATFTNNFRWAIPA